MPTRRNNGTYYFNRELRPVGKITKSLRTKLKGRARELEDLVCKIHGKGNIELIRAWKEDRIGIEELVEHYETGRLPELVESLNREPDVPLGEAIAAALRAKAADVKETTLDRYATGLAKFRDFVGDVSVRTALDTDRVQEFKAALKTAGAAKETINNDLQGVSILATYALGKGWITKRPKVKRFKTRVRIKYLEADRINVYMAAVRRPFRPIFQLLIGTGIRLGEAEALRACDLKFETDGTRALLGESKTPEGVRPVFVPRWVSEALRAHIDELGLSGTDRLFTIPRRTVQKEHNRACKIAGIPDYTIHDHRHTAAVHLAKAGMPLNLLQQQLGHVRIDMTMRYSRFHPDYNDVSTYFDRVEQSLGVASSTYSSAYTPEQAENVEVQ